ncbi:MAG: helicase-related protein [Halobacteria archaeon]|nr:helicase-related protein [Halobacteria archaeon]
MTNYEVGDKISFAGGRGEITKIEERDDSNLLFVLTEGDDRDLKKLHSTLPHIEKLGSVADSIVEKDFDQPIKYDLRRKATELDLAYKHDRFLSLTSSQIEIEPYQIQAAYEILNSYDHRYLIADEVGLGKTIEAGIVIEELVARDRADRILIVSPAPLTTQWQDEMRDKFGRDYVVYDRGYVNATRNAHPNKNVWEQENHVITSIDFAKQDDMLEPLKNAEWDVAVFDESHHLTAKEDEKTERYEVGEAVSDNTDGLIFLTGTPHSGKSVQFYKMVSLLDPYRFTDESDITPDELDDLMIRRLKSDMVEPDGTPMFPEKEIRTLPVDFTPQERDLYENVTEYITEHYNEAKEEGNQATGFAMAIYQKRLVSSIHAIRKSLKKRVRTIQNDAIKEDISNEKQDLIARYSTDPTSLTSKQREKVEKELQNLTLSTNPERVERELDIVKELKEQAENVDVDSKAEKLREFVEGVLQEDPDERILIFTEYTDTLEYLRDEVLSNYDIAQIHGDIDHDRRRAEQRKFEDEVNIMLATDAAQEGINLQFAHIMVNYDLPWNPNRIDQRMGRLHRYGQENTVQIHNLFVRDTRENKILDLLMDKIDAIESDLGMSSDVLGMVLEDFDLESTIMNAVHEDSPVEKVVEDIDTVVEEQKEALETVENNFLIRDHFDPQDILDIIDESREEAISEDDIKLLLQEFFDNFGGEIKGYRPGPSRKDGDVYNLEVPEVVSGSNVRNRYEKMTFTREVALESEDIDFLSLDHPLVQSVIDYCLNEERLGGKSTALVTDEKENAPGILFNFRVGYEAGTNGEEISEDLIQIYGNWEREITEDPPETVDTLSPEDAMDHPDVDSISTIADHLYEDAKDRAWSIINGSAEEAREKREHEIDIKEEHAKRYFENEIQNWEERLEEYRRKDDEADKDMTIAIRNAETKIRDLKRERETELQRLEEEKSVIPKEPEIVNASVIVRPEDV